MIGENTEDLGEVWVNLVCWLCLGENIRKLAFARNPMELMGAILLSLAFARVNSTLSSMATSCANASWSGCAAPDLPSTASTP